MSKVRDDKTKDDLSDDKVSLKSVELQLSSVKEAFQRLRFVFVIMTIASTAILFTLWNSSFSRDRTMAFGQEFRYKPEELFKQEYWFNAPAPCQVLKDAGIPKPKELYSVSTAAAILPPSPETSQTPQHELGKRQLQQEWFSSRSIHVGLLGVHISVSDLPVIGSLSLVVITIWFFYSEKRANKALVTLLRKVYDKYGGKSEVSDMVYHEVINSLLFTRTGETDGASAGLKPRKDKSADAEKTEPSKNFIIRTFKFLFNLLVRIFKFLVSLPVRSFKFLISLLTKTNAKKTEPRKSFTDRIFKFLTYLPFTTIVTIIFRDTVALFMYSPTSGKNLRLGQLLWLEARCNYSTDPNIFRAGYSIVLMLLFESVAIACAIYVFTLCRRSRAFAKANRETLQEFAQELKTKPIETLSD